MFANEISKKLVMEEFDKREAGGFHHFKVDGSDYQANRQPQKRRMRKCLNEDFLPLDFPDNCESITKKCMFYEI